jgi:hypothetical protein
MVENLYGDLGFASTGCGENEAVHWELSVQDYRPEPVQISIVTEGNP